jgi:hypothetical protein
MRAVFISYRRQDVEGYAGRLFQDLAIQFGRDAVFMDVAGIEPGRDFRWAIEQHVASCGVLLALIGKGWLDAKNEAGVRRLDDPADFVRLETATALKRDIPVIPVLVHGGRMPRAEELPDDLKDLAYRNAVELSHTRWDSDVQLLVKALCPYVGYEEEEAGSVNVVSGLESTRGKFRTGSTAPTSGTSALGGIGQATVPERVKAPWHAIVVAAVVMAVAAGGYVSYEKFSAEKAAAEKAEAEAAAAKAEVAAAQAAAEKAAAEEAAAQKAAAQKAAADKAQAEAAAAKAEAAAAQAAAEKAAAQKSATERAAAEKAAAQKALAEKAEVHQVKELPANSQDWLDTEMDVAPGQLLEITAAGRINFWGGRPDTYSGPDGNPKFPCDFAGCVARGQPAGKLYGKIGTNPPFAIGAKTRDTIDSGGRLRLKVNDHVFEDNSGTFIVTIQLR